MTPEQLRWLNESVNEIGLAVRTVNHLEDIGVFTVADLLQRREAELMAIPNFGRKTLVEVYRCLAVIGFVRAGCKKPPPATPAVKRLRLREPEAFKFRWPRKPKQLRPITIVL